MGQIYLVRHGQASFGSANYDQLSELGMLQSRQLGAWLGVCNLGFQHVVTGGMQRHRQTASACIEELLAGRQSRLTWQIDPGFDEFDHHEVMIRHRPEFADREVLKRFLAAGPAGLQDFQRLFEAGILRWMSGEFDAEYGQSWAAFRQRCVAALERLANGAARSENTLVFTSGGSIAAICQHLMGLENRHALALTASLVNSAVTKLLCQPGRISLSYLNNFAHLERLDAPQNITYR